MSAIGINPKHLRQYVIEPTLDHLAAWEPRIKSEAAIRLLLGTAQHESRMGHFLHQVGGPACGPFQMEPATHDDLSEWIARVSTLDRSLQEYIIEIRAWEAVRPGESDASEMGWNLRYATAMARLLYWRVPEPLPAEDDFAGLGRYAKKYFNSMLGKATAEMYERAIQEAIYA